MINKTRHLLVLGVLAAAPVAVLAQEDPFSAGDATERKVEAPKTIRAVYEVFSLPMKEAAAIQRSGIDDGKFYQMMLDGLKKKTVTQETFMVTRLMSGTKVELFEGREYIYQTEVNPPELPNMVATIQKTDSKGKGGVIDVFPVTPASPTSFETKNVGKSFELEAALDGSGKMIDLRIAASEVALIQRDDHGQGMSKVEMPRFAAPSLKTGVVVFTGKPSYLGTISPPAELQLKEGAARVWFSFVTVSSVKL